MEPVIVMTSNVRTSSDRHMARLGCSDSQMFRGRRLWVAVL